MRQIRYGVFETNSSTTHSISIIRERIPKADIPFNQHVVLKLNDFLEDFDEGEEVKYATQLGKLGFIINLLVIYLVDYNFIVDGLPDYKPLDIKTYEDFINLYYFEWVQEVIFDVTRSTFEIDEKYIKPEYPFLYYKKFYNLDDPTVLKLFKSIREHDEKDFKLVVRTIVFDEEAVIVEKIYYDGYNWITWNR